MAPCLVCGGLSGGNARCHCQRVTAPALTNQLNAMQLVACAPGVRTLVEMGRFKFMAPHFTGMQENTITNEVLHLAIVTRSVTSMLGTNPIIKILVGNQEVTVPCKVQEQEFPLILGMKALVQLKFKMYLGHNTVDVNARPVLQDLLDSRTVRPRQEFDAMLFAQRLTRGYHEPQRDPQGEWGRQNQREGHRRQVTPPPGFHRRNERPESFNRSDSPKRATPPPQYETLTTQAPQNQQMSTQETETTEL